MDVGRSVKALLMVSTGWKGLSTLRFVLLREMSFSNTISKKFE